MAPVPLEGHQTPVTNIPQEGNRGGSISLGLLIDFIIQRTYHELTVLAELLPRKTDMERKIEIYNFSARTRQLFVRLLALVKWASSATKVEKSAHIMAFLDKQSLLFVDTADILARMARETLVHARLPNFHLPAAVEVLTTGNYNRLPACIREKIVPPDPITISEKKSTLQRLNQVIQHRLVTGNLLPQMKNLEIDAGRVTFRVEQEFSVSLTVMGDGPNVPWRLLDLEILVSDRETGDGKSLVHPMQTQYIHQLVQERLVDSTDPLSEVYHTLHYFCQSLQLEVLYSQTLRLTRDRLDDHIRIDKYQTGECLTISYWKELTNKDSGSELGYKLSVLVDQHDPAKPLAIIHTPSLANKELEVSDMAIRSNQLSMEYLLVHTIYIRTRNRLTDLKQELQAMFKGIECVLAGSPAILSVPVLQPCLRAELLLIAVDTHTGMLQCHIPQYEAPLVPELTSALNEDHSKLPGLISELRFWITQKRCEKTLQHLPATPHERLPLLYSPDHPITSLVGKHRIFVQFHRHPGVILIVSFRESDTAPCEIQCSFFLCSVRPAPPTEHDTATTAGGTTGSGANASSTATNNSNTTTTSTTTSANTANNSGTTSADDGVEVKGQVYLRLESLIEFDTFVVAHGSFTSIDCEGGDPCQTEGSASSGGQSAGLSDAIGGERTGKKRRSAGLTTRPGEGVGVAAAAVGGSGGGGKRPKSPAYFIPELAHVVALCDEQVPFVMLAQELSRREIAHQGLQIEANAAALVLKLVQLPMPANSVASPTAWAALLKRLLSVAIRVQGRGSGKSWLVEFLFYGSPLLSSHPKEQGLRRPVYFQYEMGPADSTAQMVNALLSDWAQIVNLFALVHDLAEQQGGAEKPGGAGPLRGLYSVKSYNYSRLVLAYGPHRRATLTVLWDAPSQAFRLFFGKSPASTTENAHALLKEQLKSALNRERSLAQLLHVLSETLQPLTSVCKLPILLQLGLCEKKAQIPAQTFIVMPQCVTLMRIAYQNNYCLELCFRGAGLVSLRDGAYSRFDHSNVVEGFTPIQGLSTFLSQYVDKSAIYRRRSQSEDDNPPSPVTVGDSNDPSLSNNNGTAVTGQSPAAAGMGFMGPRGPQSPAAQQQPQRESLRFHPPLTPPSGSNPNTPASPHTTNQQQQQQQQQSGPNAGQQQQQQHQAYGNSPGMSLNLASPTSLTPSTPNVLPHPSPGSGLVASPLNQMHAPSPAGLMPTSSPGPCASQVQVGHSPAGGFMQAGGHGLDGSPFPSSQSMASPAASNWANSPSMARPSPVRPGQSPGHVPLHSPQQQQSMGQQQSGSGLPPTNHVSRVLPQRSWAGAIPTLLTCETLDLLCTPSKQPSGLPGPELAPLERFLGCVYMRRSLQRFIQSNEYLVPLGSTEPGVIHLKVETLQCRVSLNPQSMQSLHIKLQPLPEHNKQWNLDELQVLERFFEQRAVAPPYKPNSLLAFFHMLNLPLNVLKDFIQIMRLEMAPALLQQCKWAVQYCLRAPPSALSIVQIGLPGVMQHKLKILFFLHLARLNLQCRDQSSSREDDEQPSLVLPLIYDARTNVTQLANERDATPGSAMGAVHVQLKRFNEFHAANAGQECSVFPSVRNLLINLEIPGVASQSSMSGPPGPMAPGQPQLPNAAMQIMPGATHRNTFM